TTDYRLPSYRLDLTPPPLGAKLFVSGRAFHNTRAKTQRALGVRPTTLADCCRCLERLRLKLWLKFRPFSNHENTNDPDQFCIRQRQSYPQEVLLRRLGRVAASPVERPAAGDQEPGTHRG